jgi:hypothetical protein
VLGAKAFVAAAAAVPFRNRPVVKREAEKQPLTLLDYRNRIRDEKKDKKNTFAVWLGVCHTL